MIYSCILKPVSKIRNIRLFKFKILFNTFTFITVLSLHSRIYRVVNYYDGLNPRVKALPGMGVYSATKAALPLPPKG